MPILKFKTTDDWQRHATPPCEVAFSLEEIPIEDCCFFCKPYANVRFRPAKVRRRYANLISRVITHVPQPIVIITKP